MSKEDYYSPLNEEAKEWVKEQQNEIYKSLNVWFICVLLASLSPALVFGLINTDTNIPQWFQRSGTILLVFSLLAEIKAQVVRDNIFVVNANQLYCHLHIQSKNKKWVLFIQYFTYFLIVIGTLITGYGDMILSKICTL